MLRRSSRIAASHPFNALPPQLLTQILMAVPVDTRARCAAVCRGWRELLADPAFWRVLDLSLEGGIPDRLLTLALVFGVSWLAAGQLRVLIAPTFEEDVMNQACYHIMNSNRTALRTVQTNWDLSAEDFEELLPRDGMPALELLTLNGLTGDGEELLRMLRHGWLQATRFSLEDDEGPSVATALELGGALAVHPLLQHLDLGSVGSEDPAVVNALLDAACARRIPRLTIHHTVELRAANVPAMERLLRCNCLETLWLDAEYDLEDEASAEVTATRIGAALQHCRSLTYLSLSLHSWRLLSSEPVWHALTTLLDTLESLDLSGNLAEPEERVAAGRALGALVASNPPRLTELNVEDMNLGDEGVEFIVEGFATNTNIWNLNCGSAHDGYSGLGEDFVRDRLAPVYAEAERRRLRREGAERPQ